MTTPGVPSFMGFLPEPFLDELARILALLVGDNLYVLNQRLRESHRPLLDILALRRGWGR